MTYETIKARLHVARRLLRAGELLAADATVRSLVGQGLTPADLRTFFSGGELRQLRAVSK